MKAICGQTEPRRDAMTGCGGRGGLALVWVLLLAEQLHSSAPAVPRLAGQVRQDRCGGFASTGFRSTCWECRKGVYAKRRFSVRQCRSPPDVCARGQGHTACDWTDDPREQQGEVGVVGRGEAQRIRWEAQFAELQRFKEKHGHCNVPQSGRVDDADGARWCRLARWINKQERMQRRQRLASDRRAKLLQLGFVFGNNTFSAAWEQHYTELLHFKQDHGHCNVPTWRPSAGLSASFVAWVDRQRRRNKANGASLSLTPARRLRLNALGFVWDLKQLWWDTKLEALVALCRGQGAGWKDLPANLKNWLNEQRTSNIRGALPGHRQRLLDASGVYWRAPNQTESYAQKVDLLASFKTQHGHCCVPSTYVTTSPTGEHFRLGEWCSKQRMSYTRAMLKPERLRQFTQLGVLSALWGKRGKRAWRYSTPELHLVKRPSKPSRCARCRLHFKSRAEFVAHTAQSCRAEARALAGKHSVRPRAHETLQLWAASTLTAGEGEEGESKESMHGKCWLKNGREDEGKEDELAMASGGEMLATHSSAWGADVWCRSRDISLDIGAWCPLGSVVKQGQARTPMEDAMKHDHGPVADSVARWNIEDTSRWLLSDISRSKINGIPRHGPLTAGALKAPVEVAVAAATTNGGNDGCGAVAHQQHDMLVASNGRVGVSTGHKAAWLGRIKPVAYSGEGYNDNCLLESFAMPPSA